MVIKVTERYDSCEFEVPIEHAAEVIELCFYYLNEYPQTIFPWLTLPIGCEGEAGISWGNCFEVHRGITQEEFLEDLEKLKQST